MENNNVKEIQLSGQQITTFDDLKKYADGQVVELPAFAVGQPFIVRMKRPSMFVLAKTGKIPNHLLKSANELFVKGGGSANIHDEKMFEKMYELFEVIADASLISPTLTEIKNAGIELSDDQIMAIYKYSQEGVKALDSFRKE